MPEAPVIIAGAGPNGLMLACELALAGVRAVVVDRLPAPSEEPKANGLVGQVVRQLDMRGLYARIAESSSAPKPVAAWMFSGVPVPLAEVADNPVYAQLIAQPELVRLLYARARELGAEVRWGHEVVGFEDRGDGIVTTVAAPEGVYAFSSQYLVGADGGRSAVRKLAGIDFPGHTADTVARIGHVRVPEQWRTGSGGLDVPGFGRVEFGHTRLDRGGIVYAEFEPGRPMLGTIEFGSGAAGSASDKNPMTVGELRDSVSRVLGVDLPIEEPADGGPQALRRIAGQNTRQATRYRAGRVLLLGDSAHVHSAMGGPGLNLGLQDAMNLGWKLAAAATGQASSGLLDTYESERYPVGRRVMMHSMSQTALFSPGPEIGALRELFTELMSVPGVAGHIGALLAGSDVRYDVGDDHPLSGYLVPDFTLADGRRVAELLHDARPVIVRDVVEGPAAMLLRPDGYVAWAADDLAKPGLDEAVSRWFSSASRVYRP
ncbi:FAD-dependent monooxygenase [Mycobacterium sp. 236(2023)]|uniref:FAD-dependent monooxygenase n=1 Tax=Mycobacterium sp. 236(2023) TaxID=3038163 RepID=UPI00241580EA|nr:FAD-dependent monooxygenase [Mycobacterium sp. 236(2023)]MDG4664118.1 FAD-dependent monooxygenase [Mycobacterium sp. 236(2023)]